MLTILLVAAILAAILLPTNKLAFYALLVVIFIAIAGNLDNPDRSYYLENFQRFQAGQPEDSFEKGYQFLASLFAKTGIDYEWFHAILTFVALFLIAKTITDLTNRPALPLLGYVAFPFFWDVTQVRNFYAMAVLIYGMRYLVTPGKHSMQKFVGVVILASFLHITSLFYLLFAGARVNNKKVFIALVGCAALLYTILFSRIVSSPMLAFLAEKIDVYTTTTTSLLTKSSIIAFYLTTTLFVWWAVVRISACQQVCFAGAQRPKYMAKTGVVQRALRGYHAISPELLLKMNIVAGLSILLALDNLDFLRLFRNIFAFNVIFIANAIQITKTPTKWFFYVTSLLFLATVFIGFSVLTASTDIISITLQNNVLGNSY